MLSTDSNTDEPLRPTAEAAAAESRSILRSTTEDAAMISRKRKRAEFGQRKARAETPADLVILCIGSFVRLERL